MTRYQRLKRAVAASKGRLTEPARLDAMAALIELCELAVCPYCVRPMGPEERGKDAHTECELRATICHCGVPVGECTTPAQCAVREREEQR